MPSLHKHGRKAPPFFFYILINESILPIQYICALTKDMRRIFLLLSGFLMTGMVMAQNDSTSKTLTISRPQPRSNDHFMLQLGYTTWNGKPDSINTSGFSRSFNAYFLFDFPFRTNPRFSAAIGAGFGTDHIFFEDTYIGIKDPTSTLVFQDRSDTTHFKKYKLATAYLEAPVELRFSSRPDDNKKSIKLAIGAKVGTLLSATAKGKNLESSGDQVIQEYTSKEKSKQFFNKTRLAATARIGYGHFSIFTSYAITPVFREGVGPDVRPLTIGLTLSGL
jgi:hypothetical protein